MSFDWTGLIRFSEAIKNSPPDNIDDEVVFRSIINRCYYGAFIYARNKAKYQIERSKRVHQDVAKFYLYQADPSLKKVGRNLETLFEYRKTADYQDDWAREIAIENAVTKALKCAKSIEGILREKEI